MLRNLKPDRMNTDRSSLMSNDSIDELYVLVRWPFVQEFMDYEWFRQECFLYQAFDDQPYLASAYFVPVSRIMAIRQPG
jgi:hypothetical protein